MPVHKKEDKQCLKNYRVCCLFVATFLKVSFIIKYLPFLNENNFISPNRSGFRPGDAYVN